MTREHVIKHWNEIQAFKDGKEIEMRRNGEEWKLNRNPMFANDFEYRIKPEPELIPFDYSDAEFLIGKSVKRKDNSELIQTIVQIQSDMIYIGVGVINFTYLLENCIFIDGSICGKIKQ